MKATLRELDQIAGMVWYSFKVRPVETIDTALILIPVILLTPRIEPDFLPYPDLQEVTIE